MLQIQAKGGVELRRLLRGGTSHRKFVGGDRQSLRSGKMRRRWRMIALMDGAEMMAMARFFEQQQGRTGLFVFEDPDSLEIFSPCRFAEDRLWIQEADEGLFRVQLTVDED
jgi:hypothetical protein